MNDMDMLMIRALACTVALLASAAPVAAADFALELVALAGKESRRTETASSPRPVLSAAADTPITVRWTVRNTDKEPAVKDVLVHVFVVKEERLDQPEVPKLTKGVVLESALTTDFKPQGRTEGEVTFRITEAGCYMIRLELKGAAAKGEREPFTALDLQIR
jgi:hypothetical protein